MLAYSQSVLEALTFGHVLLAVLWVGGGIFVQYYATRLSRADDPVRMAAFARDIEKAGMQFFMPTSILVLVFGIALVMYGPADFSDTWILLGLAGYAATFVTGAFFLGPTAGKLGKALDADGPTASTTQALIRRIFTISRIDQVVLVLVIADMVFKPGA